MPAFSLLHGGHPVTWSAWHFEPSIIAGALLAFALYTWGVRTTPPVDLKRAASFVAGTLLLFLALTSPLDAGADRLLSLHMLQHIALTTFGPPLILLGLPQGMAQRYLRSTPVRGVLSALSQPFLAAAIFIVHMWLWHVPPLYEAALDHQTVHIAMHLGFMATGLLFWWPVIQPSALGPGLSHEGRLLYLFITGFPMAILALALLATPTVIYDHYALSPRLWGISALADQQVAGAIMGLVGDSASFIAFSLLFVRVMSGDDQPAPATTNRR